MKVFREAAREGLEEQAKKKRATSSKNLKKLTLGQNVRIKIPDIDRAKMDTRSTVAVITDITMHSIYKTDVPLLPQSTPFIYLVNIFFFILYRHLCLFIHKMSCIS